jgi:hypothetical protein
MNLTLLKCTLESPDHLSVLMREDDLSWNLTVEGDHACLTYLLTPQRSFQSDGDALDKHLISQAIGNLKMMLRGSVAEYVWAHEGRPTVHAANKVIMAAAILISLSWTGYIFVSDRSLLDWLTALPLYSFVIYCVYTTIYSKRFKVRAQKAAISKDQYETYLKIQELLS